MSIEKSIGSANPGSKSKNDPSVEEKKFLPENMAENNFNNFLNSDYYKTRLQGLRGDILSLQAPGEIYLYQTSRKDQEEITVSYGGERFGTGRHHDVTYTVWNLRVGTRKKERGDWGGDYKGGKSFVVSSGEYTGAPEETAEQVRDKLIAKKSQQIKDEFDSAKKINLPLPDPRSSTLDLEEWNKRYETRWNEMQKVAEDQWKVEDDQLLAEKKQSWEQYEKAAKDLRKAREEVEQAERLARVSGLMLEIKDKPYLGNIGEDTLEQIQTEAASLHAYAVKISELIPRVIKLREQELRTKEDEEAYKKAKAQAEIEQFGVSGRLLTVARSLATEAENQLGLVTAQKLFRDTCDAGYGAFRRTQDIKKALGEKIPEESMGFYGLQRARDTNAVLYAVLRILSGDSKADDTPHPDKSIPESTEEPKLAEVKIEELPHLEAPQKKDWFHLSNGVKHFNKLSKEEKGRYDAGERVEVMCTLCNSLSGYLQK